MKKILKNLFVGQEVIPVNDSNIAKVLERVGPNKYRILWKGREVVANRNQLSVRVFNGIRDDWRVGTNTTDTPQ